MLLVRRVSLVLAAPLQMGNAVHTAASMIIRLESHDRFLDIINSLAPGYSWRFPRTSSTGSHHHRHAVNFAATRSQEVISHTQW